MFGEKELFKGRDSGVIQQKNQQRLKNPIVDYPVGTPVWSYKDLEILTLVSGHIMPMPFPIGLLLVFSVGVRMSNVTVSRNSILITWRWGSCCRLHLWNEGGRKATDLIVFLSQITKIKRQQTQIRYEQISASRNIDH